MARRLWPAAPPAGLPDEHEEGDRRGEHDPDQRARATSRASARRAGSPARPSPPQPAMPNRLARLTPGASSRVAQLVAHGHERVDRLVSHRRLRLMVAEPSPFEEIGEPPDGSCARVEGEQGPLDVLERCLRGLPREPGGGEGGLHPRVGGDDRAAQVRVGPQVVERLVERGRDTSGRRPAWSADGGGGSSPLRAPRARAAPRGRSRPRPSAGAHCAPGLHQEACVPGACVRARLRPLLGIPEPVLEAAAASRIGQRDKRRDREEEHGREAGFDGRRLGRVPAARAWSRNAQTTATAAPAMTTEVEHVVERRPPSAPVRPARGAADGHARRPRRAPAGP